MCFLTDVNLSNRQLTIVLFEYCIRIHTSLYTRASRFLFTYYIWILQTENIIKTKKTHFVRVSFERAAPLRNRKRELLLLHFPWFYDSKLSQSGNNNNNNNNRWSFSSDLGLRLFVSANWEFWFLGFHFRIVIAIETHLIKTLIVLIYNLMILGSGEMTIFFWGFFSRRSTLFFLWHWEMSDHLSSCTDRLVTSDHLNSDRGSNESSGESSGTTSLSSSTTTKAIDDKTVQVEERDDVADEEEEPLIQSVECRICQDEDSVKNLESPCSCSGSLKVNYLSWSLLMISF